MFNQPCQVILLCAKTEYKLNKLSIHDWELGKNPVFHITGIFEKDRQEKMEWKTKSNSLALTFRVQGWTLSGPTALLASSALIIIAGLQSSEVLCKRLRCTLVREKWNSPYFAKVCIFLNTYSISNETGVTGPITGNRFHAVPKAMCVKMEYYD